MARVPDWVRYWDELWIEDLQRREDDRQENALYAYRVIERAGAEDIEERRRERVSKWLRETGGVYR